MVGPRTFRTRLLLRLAVTAAGALWVATAAYLAQLPGVAPRTLLSAAAFAAFFAAFGAYYDRLAITVTGEGVVFCRLGARLPVRFEDILLIEVYPGIGGTFYEVLTRRGRARFSSLVSRHRELLALLRDRAHLSRRS